MNGINENISETEFVLYERNFNVKDKTIDKIFEYSLTVKDEMFQTVKDGKSVIDSISKIYS